MFFTRLPGSYKFGFNVNTQGVMMVTPWLTYWLTHGYEVLIKALIPKLVASPGSQYQIFQSKNWLLRFSYACKELLYHTCSHHTYITLKCIIHAFCVWKKICQENIFSSDRSPYSDGGLLYIYPQQQPLFQILTQSTDAIDVTSVTLSRLNSINAIDVTRCKFMLIECSNVPMFQWSNVHMFKC